MTIQTLITSTWSQQLQPLLLRARARGMVRKERAPSGPRAREGPVGNPPCLGNTSGDETDGSMIPAQIGIFALPSL